MPGTDYDVGDEVEFSAHFEKRIGQPADPASVSFRVQKPSGAVVPYTEEQLSNPEIGTWSIQVLIDEPGEWHFEFVGTGTVVAVEDGTIRVAVPKIPAST